MKRLVLIIVFMIIMSFASFPQQLQYLEKADCRLAASSESTDDDSLMKVEGFSYNYARKDKRVKVQDYITECETARAEKAVGFRLLEFDFDKVFTESAKRDYSGDDPFNIA